MRSERLPEEADLDPWAEQLVLQERRLSADADHKREMSRTRWNIVWTVMGIAATGGALSGIFATISWHMDKTRDRDLLFEREFTEQVEACTTLGEPLERQYCLIQLNADEPATEEP